LSRAAGGESTPAGWRVVFACFLSAVFAWGFGFYAHGIYLVELQKAHGWSTGLISSVITGHYVLGALLLPRIADAIGRFGPRAVFLCGLAVTGGSLLLLPSIQTNIRAGRLPPADSDGIHYLKIPVRLATSASVNIFWLDFTVTMVWSPCSPPTLPPHSHCLLLAKNRTLALSRCRDAE